MLKLTRHLFSWAPHSQYFEFYERAHLNHILAHQNPKTGMFTYMTPLMSGMPREFSTEDDSFWCCHRRTKLQHHQILCFHDKFFWLV